MEKIIVIVGPTDTGYSCLAENLGDDIVASVGGSWKELKENMKEAIEFHFDMLQEDGELIPEKFRNGYELEFQLELTMFFELFPYLKQSAIADFAGINGSLFRQYVRKIKNPSTQQLKKIEQAIHRIGEAMLEFRLP